MRIEGLFRELKGLFGMRGLLRRIKDPLVKSFKRQEISESSDKVAITYWPESEPSHPEDQGSERGPLKIPS